MTAPSTHLRPVRSSFQASPHPGTRLVDVREVIDTAAENGGDTGAAVFVGPDKCPGCFGRFFKRTTDAAEVCASCDLRSADDEGDVRELRRMREQMGLSQADLGHLLGVHPNTVAKWETSRQIVSHPKLVGLALRALRPLYRKDP
jgi:DNA-binding transcriptional regulator YiaG